MPEIVNPGEDRALPTNPLLGGVIDSLHLAVPSPIPESGPSQHNVNAIDPLTLHSAPTPQANLTSMEHGLKLQQLIKNIPNYAYDPNKYSKVQSYGSGYDQKNFERYYSHSGFNKLGFSPFRDNEAVYNENTSAWSDFVRAGSYFPSLMYSGAKSVVRSWGDLVSGNPLKNDLTTGKEFDKIMKVASSSREGLSGGLTNFVLNSAYTFGIIAEVLAEDALGTLLTGGAASEMLAAKTGKTLYQLGGNLKNFGQGVKNTWGALQNLERVEAARVAWEGTKEAGKTLARAVIPFKETLGAALGSSKSVEGLIKSSPSFGSFYRDIREINFALSEGKLEGGMTQIDLDSQLSNDFYEKNGRMPNEAEARRIQQSAIGAGNATTMVNLPAIYYSNRLVFDNFFRGFKPGAIQAAEFATKANTKIGFNAKLVAEGKDPFTAIEQNLKTVAKSLYSPRVYAKTGIKYFKGNITEGLQENIQDVISGSAKDYYTGIYQNPNKANSDELKADILRNTGKIFTAQGFETFASGFAMGGLINLVSPIPGWAKSGYYKYFKKGEYDTYKNQRADYTKKKVDDLNILYKDPLKYFDPVTRNLTTQADLAAGMDKAEDLGDSKVKKDLEDESVWSHINTILETGSYEVFIDRLKSIKSMDPKSIQEAYGREGTEVLSRIDQVIDRAESIRKNYNFWNSKAPNPYDYSKFEKGTDAYKEESLSWASWESAKRNAIFMNHSFNRTIQRMNEITSAFSNVKPLEKASASDFSLLFNPSDIDHEMSALRGEISAYKESTTPEGKKLFSDKKEKLSQLEKLGTALLNYRMTLNLQGAIKNINIEDEVLVEGIRENLIKEQESAAEKLHQSYKGYVEHLASIKQDNSLDEAVNQSFGSIIDFYSLENDSKNLTAAINVLHNPGGFTEHFRRMKEWMTQEFDNRAETIQRGQEEMMKIKETNALINRLYEKGITIEATDLEEYIKTKKIPDTFYNIANKRIIEPGTDEYQEAAAILVDHEVATAPLGEVQVTSTEEAIQVTEEPKEITPRTPWTELPQEVKEDLEPLFNIYFDKQQELGPIEESQVPAMRQTWISTNLEARRIINDYRLKYKMQGLEGSTRMLAPIVRTKKISSDDVEAMTPNQLNSILEQLEKRQEQAKKKKEPFAEIEIRERDLKDLREYIDYRKGLEPKPTAQSRLIDTVEKIKEAQKRVQGRSEDEKFYIIDGVPYQRVTSVIDPIEKEITGRTDFRYPGLDAIIEMYNKTVGTGLPTADFITFTKALELPQFNERKYELLRKGLEKENTLENLEFLVNDLAYDDSRLAGNAIDKATREFFQTGSIKVRPEGMTEEAFVDLLTHLRLLEKEFERRDLAIMAENIVIYDPNLKIAGEVDMLAADRDGNVYVFDIKTSRKDKWDAYDDLKSFKSNKIKHELQLSAYGNILFNNYGINVKGLGVIPFQIKYDKNGNIQELTSPGFNIKKPEKGTIIYTSAGLGKSTLAEKFPNIYVDADKVLYNWMLNNNIPTESAQKSGLDFFKYLENKPDEEQTKLKDQVRVLLTKAKESGKIVLTSNFWAYDMADQIYITKDVTRIAKEFEKRGSAPEKALKGAEGVVAREGRRFAEKDAIIVPEGAFMEDIINKKPTIIQLNYTEDIEKVIPKKKIKVTAKPEEEVVEEAVIETEKTPEGEMSAQQVQDMINASKDEIELDRARGVLVQLYAGDQLNSVSTDFVKELIDTKRKQLSSSLDNIKFGDILIAKNPVEAALKDKLYRVDSVAKDTVGLRLLNASKSEIITINRADISKFAESKYTEQMIPESQKPETSPQEKMYARVSKDDNQDFTADTGAIKELADKTEKAKPEDINDEFIDGLGCK